MSSTWYNSPTLHTSLVFSRSNYKENVNLLLTTDILELYCKYLTNPRGKDVTQGQFLSGIMLVWIWFSFSLTGCLIKPKEHSLANYLPITGCRADGFMHFPKALAQR